MTDDWLDDESMTGDPSLDSGQARADTDGIVACPYCGEPNEIALDPGSGAQQEYIEDCHVCCRPWRVTVSYDAQGNAHVHADAADDPMDMD